jgi:hypothetical protein
MVSYPYQTVIAEPIPAAWGKVMAKEARACIGQTYGMTVRHDIPADLAPKDDWHMTCARFDAEGLVHRYDGIAAMTVMRAPGGIATELGGNDQRRAVNDTVTTALLERWGHLLEEIPARASGDREVKVRSELAQAFKAARAAR